MNLPKIPWSRRLTIRICAVALVIQGAIAMPYLWWPLALGAWALANLNRFAPKD